MALGGFYGFLGVFTVFWEWIGQFIGQFEMGVFIVSKRGWGLLLKNIYFVFGYDMNALLSKGVLWVKVIEKTTPTKINIIYNKIKIKH